MKKILSLCLFVLFTHGVQADELTQWVQDNRIELESMSSKDAKEKIRHFLSNKLAGKRFVYLGEGDHYFHEKYLYRELIMPALIELGYTNILNEFGRADSKKINQYLQSGDEAHLRRVCFYGFCDQSPKLSVYGSEEIRYYKSIYRMSAEAGKKLRHYGWDLDMSGLTAYPEIEKVLKQMDGAHVQKVLSRLERLAGETWIQEGDRVYEALALFHAYKKEFLRSMSHAEYLDLYWDIRTLADSLKLAGQCYKALDELKKDPQNKKAQLDMYQMFLLREPTAFDRVKYIVSTLPKNAKFVVMGHNSHMAKNTQYMTMSFQSLKDYPMWKSVGEMININFPGETFHIWMGIGQGENGYSSDPCWGAKPCPSVPVAGTIEEKFSSVSSGPWIVSLERAPMGETVWWSAQFREKESGNLKKAADAYFFIPQTSALSPQ